MIGALNIIGPSFVEEASRDFQSPWHRGDWPARACRITRAQWSSETNQVCLITAQVVLLLPFLKALFLLTLIRLPQCCDEGKGEHCWGWPLACLLCLHWSFSIKGLISEGVSNVGRTGEGQVWERPFEVGSLVNRMPVLMAAGMFWSFAPWWWPLGVTLPNCGCSLYFLGPLFWAQWQATMLLCL